MRVDRDKLHELMRANGLDVPADESAAQVEPASEEEAEMISAPMPDSARLAEIEKLHRDDARADFGLRSEDCKFDSYRIHSVWPLGGEKEIRLYEVSDVWQDESGWAVVDPNGDETKHQDIDDAHARVDAIWTAWQDAISQFPSLPGWKHIRVCF